ncbi:MOSC domain-containing protein [Streptomyces sp. NPDC086549]|uniref:MOSC domain-containing protein n=1 Tax=Streptomyces sp. NPDC086549 TaxID=3365752 RepID=UPI003808B361
MRATIDSLWRYPVKSMLGERVRAAHVDRRGLTGDRRLALLDRDTGRVASAKHPRLWRALLTCGARTDVDGVRITLPCGKTWSNTDADVDAALSELVGRTVALTHVPPPEAELDRSDPERVLSAGLGAEVPYVSVRFGSASPPGTFFDFAPVHLITTATLRRLSTLHPHGTVEAERYRPNLVLDIPGEGFAEHDWIGRELRIGERLALRVIASTPRCAVPTLAHGALPRDPDALRLPAVHHSVPALPGRSPEPCAGVYAQVVRDGQVREGDSVRF